MALTWALFALALAGWLAVTAVIWSVLYAAAKRRLALASRDDTHRREGGEESGTGPSDVPRTGADLREGQLH